MMNKELHVIFQVPRNRMAEWLLDHPSRLSWIILEFMRPYSFKRRFNNALYHVRRWEERK